MSTELKAVRGGFKKSGAAPTSNALQSVQQPIEEERRNLSILDESDPYSLINMVPPDFAKILKETPRRYFELTESELEKELKPTDTLSKLKLRFWDEWQTMLLAQFPGKISLSSVYYGVCSKEYFYANVLKVKGNVAWIVTPPEDYVVTMRDVLRTGINRLKEVLQLPIITETPIMAKGVPIIDPTTNLPYMKRTIEKSVISEIRQVVSMLSDRVHGAVVQRFDLNQTSKSMSLNLSASAQEAMGLLEKDPMPAIESTDELLAIDAQIDKISKVLAPFDTEAKISAAQAKLDEGLPSGEDRGQGSSDTLPEEGGA